MRSLPRKDLRIRRATLSALEWAGRTIRHGRGATVYSSGDDAASIVFLRKGRVNLTVRLPTGKEAVVARIRAGEFFGEACLAGQRVRRTHATATVPSTVLVVEPARMRQLLRERPELAAECIARMLARNVRMEQELFEQLFSSTETRLARVLLRLAGYGTKASQGRALPPNADAALPGKAGLSRQKVAGLMRSFRRRGFITQDGTTRVQASLMHVVLHD